MSNSLALRLPVSFVLALAVTGSVFWFLASLIATDFHIDELAMPTRIEFTRLRRDTETAVKRREKPVRQTVVGQPGAPQMQVGRIGLNPAPAAIPMIGPTVDGGAVAPTGIGQIGGGAGGSDRDVIPLVRINPEYPMRAQQRGIEGWVLVEFTITPAGTVSNARVIDSEPKGTFDSAALRAIGRWRYNPKVEGGVAIERHGVQVLLDFKLER
ncbi:MAG: energy transducer TonB [Deltaproteobacteria bacterium]|nr:energy transducer TonB [Deltaproteobacteria bacterium]